MNSYHDLLTKVFTIVQYVRIATKILVVALKRLDFELHSPSSQDLHISLAFNVFEDLKESLVDLLLVLIKRVLCLYLIP